MSILIDASTRAIVQGITGSQARFDTQWSLLYGSNIVAGVTPGRGGEEVHGVPVFDTVRRAVAQRNINASVIYVPPAIVKSAVLEAIDSGIKLIVVTAEYVPQHDLITIVAAARQAQVRLVGCNTNGLISPGQCKLGGVGGIHPDEIYPPGRIGICSRSGGMMAEISLELATAGYGVSTSVAMGGDAITGLRMADYVTLFDEDPETDAIVLFGEPGTDNESEVANLLRSGNVKKPIVALIAGEFQERYPSGLSFGHAAAMITDQSKSATSKRQLLRDAGAHVAISLQDVPSLLRLALT
ncbi:MAG TPA: succinate--CoA ligase subunit alpha [Eoetvoesiella sp.]